MLARFFFLFRGLVWRHIRRHSLLALLNMLAVALGVAVFVAVQIANRSAARGFEAGVDLVAGKAQLEVRGPLDDALFPAISHTPGVRAATPVIEELATTPDFPGEYLRVLGIDVFMNAPFRTFEIGGNGQSFALEPWLANPHGLAVSDEFARIHHLRPGDSLRLLINSRTATFTVLDLIPLHDLPAGSAGVPIAAMDIGWAQENFHERGRLSSVQLLLDDPAHPEAIQQRLSALLPADVRVEAPGQRSLQVEKMLGAFQLNLTALSLVSLLVGMFLIYNTLFASTARRRVEIGILRSLGVTRMEVRALFLGEAMFFGVCGTAAGLVGGVALAQALSGSVARTISSLYLLVSIRSPFWDGVPFAAATALGLTSVLVGAWVPANEAAKADPVKALSHGARLERFQGGHAWRWALGGLALLGLAWVCSAAALRTTAAWLSFAAAFFVMAGFALFAPCASARAGWLAARLRSTIPRMAGENVRRTVHRSAVTVAALGCAIAMMIGVSVMIFSFRQSVENWISRGIVADLFVAPASNEVIGLHAFLPPETLQALAADPGVEELDTYRQYSAHLDSGEPVELGIVTGADRRNLHFVNGGDRAKMHAFFAGDLIVTESFARRQNVAEGYTLRIRTPAGLRAFHVAGVYYDYTSDRGVIMMDRAVFDRLWHDPGVNSAALYLRPGADAKVVAERARKLGGGGLLVYANSALRGRILAIFDQTFAVTGILRTIAVIVALVGLFLSLTALVIEREREIGILRALGGSRRQIGAMLLGEAALLGAVASGIGVASGLCLSMVLTWVVNKAFFGWTIELQLPIRFIVTTPLWIIGAAVLAALWPALQAARVPIAAALREE